jgi:hypothetical protein
MPCLAFSRFCGAGNRARSRPSGRLDPPDVLRPSKENRRRRRGVHRNNPQVPEIAPHRVTAGQCTASSLVSLFSPAMTARLEIQCPRNRWTHRTALRDRVPPLRDRRVCPGVQRHTPKRPLSSSPVGASHAAADASLMKALRHGRTDLRKLWDKFGRNSGARLYRKGNAIDTNSKKSPESE